MNPFSEQFPRAVQLAQTLIRSRVSQGETVIDGTAGNGHDTVFLAELVGGDGKVLAFDIQEAAVDSTRQKTEHFKQVEVYHDGHENIRHYPNGEIKAAMFNLGYLPGGDKKVITRPATTISALEFLSENLTRMGIITVVVYSGHVGGTEESTAIREWCEKLDQDRFTVISYGFINQRNSPPSVLAIERK